MKVTFTRTGGRRYRVSVEGPGVVSSWMEPAPGYDARLPHDMAHFVVENELGITGGIFGQLAGGGHARTFHPTEQASRRVAKRGKRIAAANRGDAMLSEKAVYLACRAWNKDVSEATRVEVVSPEDIKRVCREFDAVSAIWSKLAVGESMTLVWRGSAARAQRRRSRRM
ncbi:MAG: hypothetical protein ND866_02360 [Pyrinomonadaceae bacterium]|nr:hypothetical protein [Pyrinomonadaceae bacterium]